MANIKVLDDKTINQIAAGEVVERPVSVVKELVENAIDAGAKNISVEIKEGGISLIRVTDNGSGIDKDNIRTAFLRHATSKINSIEDLLTISSLGFRGEALSSIAAVAQIELLTKVPSSVFGIRYCIHGGKEYSFDEVGVPEGTTIIVRNLFFNTPARRKFLKSAVTEANYITELMERMILSHPSIAFKYIVNGHEKLVSSGNNDIKQGVYGVFGRDMANLVIPIDGSYEGFNIKGFVGKPESARGNRNFELFFVNNRCVKSSILSKAVEEAYKEHLMLHKYPFVVLYLEIDSVNLDVNVHPAKTEIRFLNEDVVYGNLVEAVKGALVKKELIPEVKQNIVYEPNKSILEPKPMPKVYTAPEPFEKEAKVVPVAPKTTQNNAFSIVVPEITEVKQETLFTEEFLKNENIIKHKIIGQIFDTYFIVELDDKMYIIDQHAAHEKVLYERFRKQIDEDNVYSQGLSPAIIVTLTASEIDVFNKYMENFNRLGFEVEHFGGNDYAICSVPSELYRMGEKEYFLAILDDLQTKGKVSDTKEVNDRIASMACKAAIKGNMHFTIEEGKALIDELLTLDNPYNCPHGRPTIISYSKAEIEKMFKRIV